MVVAGFGQECMGRFHNRPQFVWVDFQAEKGDVWMQPQGNEEKVLCIAQNGAN